MLQQLTVTNGKITTADGTPVLLRGTCVGGWMNLEDFINAYPGTESGIRRHIKEVLGEKNGRYFLNGWRITSFRKTTSRLSHRPGQTWYVFR